MTDQFAKWRALVSGEHKLGSEELQAHEDEVISGYYRTRRGKSEPWKPLGIWREGDELVVMLGGADLTSDPKALDKIWPYCLLTPIKYEVYQAVLGGERWPDLDPAVAAMLEARENRQGIGGNMPPDEAASLLAEVETLVAGSAVYNTIADDEALAKAQSMRAMLLEKRAAAVAKHKVEKEPHLEEGRKVDRRWFGIRDLADDVATRLRKAMEKYSDEKRDRAKAAAAAEAKAAAAAAAAAAAPTRTAPSPAAVTSPPIVPAAASGQIRGGYGKAASDRTRMTVTACKDVDEAIAHISMANATGFEEIRALVVKIAQRLVDAGAKEVPGCVIEEKSTIR